MYSESDWINKSIETGVKFKLRNSLSVGGEGKKCSIRENIKEIKSPSKFLIFVVNEYLYWSKDGETRNT